MVKIPKSASKMSASGHLFISYNRQDKDIVLTIVREIRKRGIKAFLDVDSLPLGQAWLPKIEKALESAQAVAVFLSKHGLGKTQLTEFHLALIRQADSLGQSKPFLVIPVLLPGTSEEELSGLLALNTWLDVRHDDLNAAVEKLVSVFSKDLRQNDTAEHLWEDKPLCPYRSLFVFREQDSTLFFGRDTFSKALLQKVLTSKLVTLVGDSGAGKSSVLQAGLFPLLRVQRPERWELILTVPGERPFHNVAAALVGLWSEADRTQTDIIHESERLGDLLQSQDLRLAVCLEQFFRNNSFQNQLLLVVDQFEELFTRTLKLDVQRRFAAELMTLTKLPNITVLTALRADFYSQAISLNRDFSDEMAGGQINIGPMRSEELQMCIEEPARKAGYRFAPGLISRILREVEWQPECLPLLEFALAELWHKRQGRLLTHEGFDAIGEVSGAISRRAAKAFSGMTAKEQGAAVPTLGRMVRVPEVGEMMSWARQTIRFNDLDERARIVIRSLAETRLIVLGNDRISGDTFAELAHEALIRVWKPLNEWVKANAKLLVWQQRLSVRIKEWQDSQEDPRLCLRGTALDEAQGWLRRHPEYLSDREQLFVLRSAADSFDVARIQKEGCDLMLEIDGNTGPVVRWCSTLTCIGEHQLALETLARCRSARFVVAGVSAIVETLAIVGNLKLAFTAADGLIPGEAAPALYCGLSQVLLRMGHKAQAIGSAEKAELAAIQIPDEAARRASLIGVSQVLASLGLIDRSIVAAKRIADPGWRARAFLGVMVEMAKNGDYEAVRQVTKALDIEGDIQRQIIQEIAEATSDFDKSIGQSHAVNEDRAWWKRAIWVALASARVGQGNYQGALSLVDRMSNSNDRADALTNISTSIVNPDLGNLSESVLLRIRRTLRSFHDPNPHPSLIVAMARIAPIEAVKIIRILKPDARTKVVLEITSRFLEEGLLANSPNEDSPWPISTRSNLAEVCSSWSMSLNSSEAAIRAIDMIAIMTMSLAAGRREIALELAQPTQKCVGDLRQFEARMQSVSIVASLLAVLGQPAQATLLVDRCFILSDRLFGYCSIVREYSVSRDQALTKTFRTALRFCREWIERETRLY